MAFFGIRSRYHVPPQDRSDQCGYTACTSRENGDLTTLELSFAMARKENAGVENPPLNEEMRQTTKTQKRRLRKIRF